ncbi:alpha-xenorhabdolysin family binary toxin subunit A [Massilia terrae]|uniref:Alpha-xenorhabdolysin family binary toxin subunit A n=1 Tax=Massilia terrae TaxID=1811224 RepID=A0ABT2CWT1_9BURK|nr:alpha-xenorhabdolysin family binary toxin subunit A [Massilia terrae]MCS0657563.1 alpha-xenorhabdolysin family binary toxin subunit A [Massilia terrae]
MSLLVPSPLLLQAGDSKDAQRFLLASREWLDLQTRVQAVLALPSDIGEYQERYGDASSGTQMKDCFDAMHRLQQTANCYGSPTGLRAKIIKDPGFLANATRPSNDAFSATVWTLQRTHLDAFTIASTFKSIPDLAQGARPSDTVAGIKSLFMDQGQIISSMDRTIGQLNTLITEFQGLEQKLADAQDQMKTYTDRSSKTRVELDKEIGEIRATIADLEKERDAAYGKWLGLTIAACAVPAVIAIAGIAIMVILAVPTGGGSFAVGSAITGAGAALAGAALGTAAGIARTKYEDLCTRVQEEDEFLGKRICYRSDLGALDELMKFTLPSSTSVISQLGEVRDAWNGSIRELSSRVNDLSVANLTDSPWLNQGLMNDAAASWGRLDEALKAFVRGSFVDATLIDFGDPLPRDDAKWIQNFSARKAA